eukprot:403333389
MDKQGNPYPINQHPQAYAQQHQQPYPQYAQPVMMGVSDPYSQPGQPGYGQVDGIPIAAGQPQGDLPNSYLQQNPNPYLQQNQNPQMYSNVQTVYAQQPMVIYQQPNIHIRQRFGRHPQQAKCQYCNQTMQTKVERESSQEQVVGCVILCLCVPPYCFIPYLMPSCYRYLHKCSNCNKVLGIKKVE